MTSIHKGRIHGSDEKKNLPEWGTPPLWMTSLHNHIFLTNKMTPFKNIDQHKQLRAHTVRVTRITHNFSSDICFPAKKTDQSHNLRVSPSRCLLQKRCPIGSLRVTRMLLRPIKYLLQRKSGHSPSESLHTLSLQPSPCLSLFLYLLV